MGPRTYLYVSKAVIDQPVESCLSSCRPYSLCYSWVVRTVSPSRIPLSLGERDELLGHHGPVSLSPSLPLTVALPVAR